VLTEVSAAGRSLIQRSPTEFGLSGRDLETATVRMPRPIRAVESWIYIYIYIPVRPITGPEGSKRLRLPDIETIEKEVRLSVLRTGHFYPQGTHFGRPQDYSAAGRIISINIPVTPWGIEPATFWLVVQCLQPTAPPRA
jgi:hypothetical protein